MSAGAPALLLALGVAGCGALDPVTVSVPRPAPVAEPPRPPQVPRPATVVDVSSVAIATWTGWYDAITLFGSARAVGDLDGDGAADWVIAGAEPTDQIYYPSASYTWLLSADTPTGTVRDVAGLIDLTEPGAEIRVLGGASDDDGDGRSEVLAESDDGIDRIALSASGVGWDVRGTVVNANRYPVLAMADFTGDGIGDLALDGRVHYGAIVGVRAESDGVLLPSTERIYGLACGGDLDGDGIEDLVVSSGDTIEVADLVGAPASPALGTGAYTTTTYGRNAVGDLDGDGYDDLAAGGGSFADVWNVTFVVSGPFPTVATDLKAAAVAQVGGAQLADPAAAVKLGDVDGDGYDDMAFQWSDVWYGRIALAYGPLVGVVDPETLPQIRGDTPYDGFGVILTSQDVDADGRAEVVMGAPNWGHGSDLPQGALYLVEPL